jgi:hypothetical protein
MPLGVCRQVNRSLTAIGGHERGEASSFFSAKNSLSERYFSFHYFARRDITDPFPAGLVGDDESHRVWRSTFRICNACGFQTIRFSLANLESRPVSGGRAAGIPLAALAGRRPAIRSVIPQLVGGNDSSASP